MNLPSSDHLPGSAKVSLAEPGRSRFWYLLHALGRGRDVLERVLAGVLLFIAVALTTLEIVLRNLFGTSIVGVEQIAVFLIAWSVFFGAAFGVARNIHVRVDVLQMLMPPRLRLASELIGWTGALLFSIALVISGWVLVEETHLLGDMTMGLLRIPMWIPQLVMPIAGLLLSVRIVERIVLTIRRGTAAMVPASGELVI